ncbi:MAG: hypothetical protein U0457_11130 [Candidatus Sericytochromatia bacterium]
MKKTLIILFTILTATTIIPNYSYASENPFLSNKKEINQEKEENNYFKNFYASTLKTQHKLNKEIASLTREIKENNSPKALIILMAISFLYGAFHSIGPGHGKCFVCSYFISEKNDIKKGILLGNLVAIIHALSALTLVSIIYFIFKSQSLILLEDVSKSIAIFSYSLIIIIGLSLLGKNINSLIKTPKEICKHNHEEGHICNHEHHIDKHEPTEKNKNILLVAASIGLVPCPGAISILLFSISLDVLQIGILLAFCIALGMGLTVSLLGAFTILTRKGTLELFSFNNKISKDRLEYSMKILGSIMILFFGTFFLIGNI